MIVDFSVELKHPKGMVIVDANKVPITMETAIVGALLASIEGERIEDNEKIRRSKQATRYCNRKEDKVELSLEEFVSIRKLVRHTFDTLIAGAADQIFEGIEEKQKQKDSSE